MRISLVSNICLFIFFVISPALVFSQPQIDNISGTIEDREIVMLGGNNFREKTIANPLRWDNFEECNNPPCNGKSLQRDNPSSLSYASDPWEDAAGIEPTFSNIRFHSGNFSSLHDFVIDYRSNLGYTFDPPYQGTIYMTWWRYHTQDRYNSNYKSYRVYGSNSSNFNTPQTIASEQNGASHDYYASDTNANVIYPVCGWQDYPMPTNEWIREEYLFSTGNPGNTDGFYKAQRIWSNNVVVTCDQSNLSILSHGSTYGFTNLRIGHQANQENNQYDWIDDVYLDTTQSRVELGNQPTWSDCTHREIQIPTAWSDNTITITFNQGSFNNGDTVYLYVVDENGVASESYPITIGGAITPPEDTIKGDLNSDGKVDITDVQACIAHILGAQDWETKSDVNGDGSVNVVDVQSIVNVILGN